MNRVRRLFLLPPRVFLAYVSLALCFVVLATITVYALYVVARG